MFYNDTISKSRGSTAGISVYYQVVLKLVNPCRGGGRTRGGLYEIVESKQANVNG